MKGKETSASSLLEAIPSVFTLILAVVTRRAAIGVLPHRKQSNTVDKYPSSMCLSGKQGTDAVVKCS